MPSLLLAGHPRDIAHPSPVGRIHEKWRPTPLDLQATGFADVAVLEAIGQGRRCVAFAARRRGRDLVLKHYHQRAAARHAQRCGGPIARYEYERNAAFRAVPALASFVAAPVGFVSSSGLELFLQERVFGDPLLVFLRNAEPACRGALLARLRDLLEAAHEARLFDLDLHPSNLIVRRGGDGTPVPVLFDFNKVPYHVRPPNAVLGWLVKLGLIGWRARDKRQWKHLQRLGVLPNREAAW